MSFNFKLPQIQGTDPSVQISSIQTYLYQLVEQLNHSINALDKNITETTETVIASKGEKTRQTTEKEAQASFDSLKGLIIKSADIVNAYYQKMKLRFDGIYTAQSDFGTFVERTDTAIELANDGIEVNTQEIGVINTNITTINGEIDDLDTTTSGLTTRMQIAESNITTNANAITTKVAQTEYDTDMQSVEAALGTKASAQDLTNLTGRVSTAESTITQQAGQIALKVNETDYNAQNIVDKINESSLEISGDRVDIQSDNIHLEGYTSINNGFSVDLNGNATMHNATVDGDILFPNSTSKIVGGQGLYSTLTFTSKRGRNREYDTGYEEPLDVNPYKDYVQIDAFIPSNFTIVSAYVTLVHQPHSASGVWFGEGMGEPYTNVVGYARSIAMYKITSAGRDVYTENTGIYQPTEPSGTEITSAFGSSGWTPSNTSDISMTSTSNIASSIGLTVGANNRFVFMTKQTRPSTSTTITQFKNNIVATHSNLEAILIVNGYTSV